MVDLPARPVSRPDEFVLQAGRLASTLWMIALIAPLPFVLSAGLTDASLLGIGFYLCIAAVVGPMIITFFLRSRRIVVVQREGIQVRTLFGRSPWLPFGQWASVHQKGEWITITGEGGQRLAFRERLSRLPSEGLAAFLSAVERGDVQPAEAFETWRRLEVEGNRHIQFETIPKDPACLWPTIWRTAWMSLAGGVLLGLLDWIGGHFFVVNVMAEGTLIALLVNQSAARRDRILPAGRRVLLMTSVIVLISYGGLFLMDWCGALLFRPDGDHYLEAARSGPVVYAEELFLRGLWTEWESSAPAQVSRNGSVSFHLGKVKRYTAIRGGLLLLLVGIELGMMTLFTAIASGAAPFRRILRQDAEDHAAQERRP
ncbi:MAG: hypothetical protein JXR96_22855 [Deltaproteobacteria bacterium]|nr:hypothetical protein [Deltaproteobacteria bacterium]